MSLPLGFSPFDDYDSPYASTNAAIRRQSRHVQGGANTPGHITPTSSFQQSQTRRPSQASFAGQMATDGPPARRSSPPPAIPAAEDFGSGRRFSGTVPTMDAQGVRHIAKPMPLGAPWANGGAGSSSSLSHQQRLAQQGPTTSIGRSPPVSPRSAATTLESPPSDSSAQITDNSGLVGGTSPSRRAPPPPPATSIARAQANRSKQGSQSTTPATPAQYPTHDSSQKKVVPPPMALAAALPEPADPPAADEVALATPDNADAALAHNNANSGSSTDAVGTAANMRQVGARDYDEEDAMVASPITSDDEDAHRGDAFRTPTDENPPAIAAGSDSQSPYRRNAVAAAGVGAGAAGLGAAAALSSSSGSSSDYSPRRARDAQNAAPHSAYNMTGAGAFNEKDSRSDDRALLAGGAGAGVGAAAANRSYKPLNEGSRQGWSDSPGATGAGAGGAGGSALGRSWRAHKKRWIIGIVLLLIVILAAAIGGGVAGSSGGSSSNSGSSGSNSGSGSGSGTGTSNGGGTTSGGIGPLDSRLSRSFYGINYSPQESNVGFGCGSNITGVIHDVTILSQLTSRVRLTGSACNQTALVLDAIQRLGVDMQVWAGIDLDSETTLTGTAFTGQLANLTYAFDTFGTSNIAGIYVGDEYVTSFGSAASLERFITATRDLVADNSAWGNVLVGTAETASTWSTTLAEQVDFVFANDESWDERVTGTEAAEYSYQTFQDFVVSQATDASNDPPTYVSAIGWPTADQDGDSTTIESLANLQSFLDAYVCDANTNGTGYFWFELFDDPEVEIAATGGTPNTASPGYWGLFDSDKNLKDLTLPDCAL